MDIMNVPLPIIIIGCIAVLLIGIKLMDPFIWLLQLIMTPVEWFMNSPIGKATVRRQFFCDLDAIHALTDYNGSCGFIDRLYFRSVLHHCRAYETGSGIFECYGRGRSTVAFKVGKGLPKVQATYGYAPQYAPPIIKPQSHVKGEHPLYEQPHYVGSEV